MPHLDATALTTDVDGLAFLQDLLDEPVGVSVKRAPDGVRSTMRVKRIRSVEPEPRPFRRKGAVPEAA